MVFIFKNTTNVMNLNIVLWLILFTISSVKQHWDPIFSVIEITFMNATFIVGLHTALFVRFIIIHYNWTSMTNCLSCFSMRKYFEFTLIDFFVRIIKIQLNIYWFLSCFIFLINFIFDVTIFWSCFRRVNFNYFCS